MGRVRPTLGTPFGTDGPWLAAILATLGDIADLLDARLPAPASADGGGPGSAGLAPISEPAPDAAPKKATPVSEPASDEPPAEDDDPVKVSEPATVDRQPLPPAPPRRGKGSGLDAWQAFANVAGVQYGAEAGRGDIIAACARANVIDTEGR